MKTGDVVLLRTYGGTNFKAISIDHIIRAKPYHHDVPCLPRDKMLIQAADTDGPKLPLSGSGIRPTIRFTCAKTGGILTKLTQSQEKSSNADSMASISIM
jgi:hypothetical protein